MKRLPCLVLLLMMITAPLIGQNNDYRWAAGISGISPGLPVAAKVVWQSNGWGAQVEANYFYSLGMVRIDGRKVVVSKGRWGAYGFAGCTANHFNDGNDINNTLWVDVGAAGSVKLGKNHRLELGFEGGLLIPFWSNKGLEQYDDSGFMVANAFILWWW